MGYPLQYSWASLVAQLVNNAGDLGPNTGLGRSPGEGNGYRLQCSGRHRNLAGYNQWDHKESDTAK